LDFAFYISSVMYVDQEILRQLKEWRQMVAGAEGVPVFRIFSNATLENIALVRPRTYEELLTVKGIGERKMAQYGDALLLIVQSAHTDTPPKAPLVRDRPRGSSPTKPSVAVPPQDFEHVAQEVAPQELTVSAFLDLLNDTLGTIHARVQGEISSVDIRATAVYFSLKDANDGSMMNCIMWRSNYRLCGTEFEEGMEIIVEGNPDVYKPNGRLSFKATSAELVGEGALKRQYDALKAKLTEEGLFDAARKRELPAFPQRIGLITSREGAAIGDFQVNLGNHGFQVTFRASRVEGQSAVPDLLQAIQMLKNVPIELLVIIRGGGSMESLLPFNNEMLAREVVQFPVPVLVGVGHERDVSLVALAADTMLSTPTAAAQALNVPWQHARADVRVAERTMLTHFNGALHTCHTVVDRSFGYMRTRVRGIFDDFAHTEQTLLRAGERVRTRITGIHRELNGMPPTWLRAMRLQLRAIRDMLVYTAPQRTLKRAFEQMNQQVRTLEKQLEYNNPERQLQRGYSIIHTQGRIVRHVTDVVVGDQLEIRVQDGTLTSKVTNKSARNS
jgi:exodeoxyribonuclease VII large subunit